MPRCSMMMLDHRDSAIDSFESLSPQDEHPAIGNVASQLFTAPHVDKIWYILVFSLHCVLVEGRGLYYGWCR